MPSCPDWNSDDPTDAAQIVANVAALRPSVESDARARRLPDLAMAIEWHRRIYAGVGVPHPDYVGNVRDSDPLYPCLVDYEVIVGSEPGVVAHDVPAALDSFLRATATVLAALDGAVATGGIARDPAAVAAIIRLCAYVHGEWIRIHPFANGNGRTARVWANWIALRYGLPPFVRIKPRPDDLLFSGAAQLSMRGDHSATEVMFAQMLREALRRAAGQP